MRKDDVTEFSALMLATAEIYDKSPGGELIELYFRALAALSLDEVKSALDRHIKDPDRGRFWPKPADLLRQIQGEVEQRSAQAWDDVVRQMERVGYVDNPELDDPTEYAVRLLGGWTALCRRYSQCSDKEADFIVRDFGEYYAAYTPYKLIEPRGRRQIGDGGGGGFRSAGEFLAEVKKRADELEAVEEKE